MKVSDITLLFKNSLSVSMVQLLFLQSKEYGYDGVKSYLPFVC